MRAQGIIFDIISTSFGTRPKNFEMAVGDIHQDLYTVLGIGQVPSIELLNKALELLVATGELVARGPMHDKFSILYHRPE